VNGRIVEDSGHWNRCIHPHQILKNKKCIMLILVAINIRVNKPKIVKRFVTFPIGFDVN
jgi:hypothetical protein